MDGRLRIIIVACTILLATITSSWHVSSTALDVQDLYISYLTGLMQEYMPGNSMVVIVPGELEFSKLNLTNVHVTPLLYNSVIIDGGWRLNLLVINIDGGALLILYKPIIKTSNKTLYEGWASITAYSKLEPSELRVRLYNILRSEGWKLIYDEEIIRDNIYRSVYETTTHTFKGGLRINILKSYSGTFLHLAYFPSPSLTRGEVGYQVKLFLEEAYRILLNIGVRIYDEKVHTAPIAYNSLTRYNISSIDWDLELLKIFNDTLLYSTSKIIAADKLLEVVVRARPGILLAFNVEKGQWVEGSITHNVSEMLLSLIKTSRYYVETSPTTLDTGLATIPTPTPASIEITTTPTITTSTPLTTMPTLTPTPTPTPKKPSPPTRSTSEILGEVLTPYEGREYSNLVLIAVLGALVGILAYATLSKITR